MSEKLIEDLIGEIERVYDSEFWWGSELLQRCESLRDQRLIKALLLGHHSLENKEADSCHVIRNTIKVMDGPNLDCLWSIIDSENDTEKIISTEEDPYSLLWASAYVLGEIGGRFALGSISSKLHTQNIGRQYILIRVAMHLLGRYKTLDSVPEPVVQIIDTKTGEVQEKLLLDLREDVPWKYERYLLRKKQENEYFVPVDRQIIPTLYQNIDSLDDRVFPVVKQQLLQCVEELPK